jgi:hypothetical protein
MSDTIDINISPVVENVTLTIEPNLTTINVNTINGGGGIESVVAGANISVDNTDPDNPIVSATGLVPYTGATSDVNLGEFGVLTGNLEFDNTPTNIPTAAGGAYWNDSDGTLDLILKGGNVKLQVGQESVIRVVNKTATNIDLLEANYQAVRVTGAQGQRLKVDLAQATTDILSAETIGLVTETINNNQEGFITTSGLVRNINTTGSLQGETWADGDIVYLSPTVAGRITKVKPVAPSHLVIIGYVVSAHATQGSIFVKVDNGYELDELHNVKIDTPLNNQSLVYNSSLEVWENKTITIDATPTDGSSNAVSSNGVFDALELKQNKSRFLNSGYVTVTGVTNPTVAFSIPIPANTYATEDAYEIVIMVNKSVTATAVSFDLYHDTSINGTSNAIATALSLTASGRYGSWLRALILSDGSALNRLNSSSSASNYFTTSSGGLSTTTYNPAVMQYITLVVNGLTVVSESANVMVSIRPLK